ncbi:MAG: hypothetical protein JJD97_10525, partial [Gemmatimonadaceae bacterium]|nr:hypothetical protein [Gemmatimonadaceae bacterium]
MEDRPEDLPKPPRRTAARPFFSPRPNSGEGATGPLELNRRRSAQLFTPPGSSPAAPVADKAVADKAVADKAVADKTATQPMPPVEDKSSHPTSSAADGSSDIAADARAPEGSQDFEFESDWTPAPLVSPERTLDAESLLGKDGAGDDDQFVVEQYEHKEIELSASSTIDTSEHSIEVIEYDDANSLLKAAAGDGKNPRVDGLQLETTEFSFEHEAAPPMNVDGFWDTEPFSAPETSAVADETEATIDEETAGEPAIAMDATATEPSIDEQPFEWTDDPSTTIAHAQAALEPEPEHDPEPAAQPPLGDIAPPWLGRETPVSTQALEELKESEPWDLTSAHSQEAIAEEAIAEEAIAEEA